MGIIQKILVYRDAVVCLPSMNPALIFSVLNMVAFLEKQYVSRDFRPGVRLKRGIRQPDRPEQFGPLREIPAECCIRFIEGSFGEALQLQVYPTMRKQ